MNSFWRFLRDKRNQQVLGWLGGGLVVVATGLWAAFVYLSPEPTPPSVHAGQGSIAIGGNVTRIDGGDEHHGRAAVAGAVDAEAGCVHLGLRAHEGQRRLHVGDAAIGRQTGFRPVAVAPALVVPMHNDSVSPAG